MVILSRSGGGYISLCLVLFSSCVALRSHVRPLTHTPSHTAHHFNRYDRVNREKAELHLQLLEGVDSSMRAIILEQEQEHVQKTRRSEDQQRLTLEALQVGLNFRGVTYL